MRAHWLGVGLLVALLMSLSTLAAEEPKKKDNPKGGNGDVIDSDKLPPGQFVGQIKSFGKELILDIVTTHVETTPGRATRGRPARPNYKTVTDHNNVEIHINDGTKVRYKDPPAAFDEKGNPKKYTGAELSEMKGKDKNLPGYEGNREMLHPGQTVQVTLVRDSKDKDGDGHKMEASLVLIVEEGSQAARGNKGDKKDK